MARFLTKHNSFPITTGADPLIGFENVQPNHIMVNSARSTSNYKFENWLVVRKTLPGHFETLYSKQNRKRRRGGKRELENWPPKAIHYRVQVGVECAVASQGWQQCCEGIFEQKSIFKSTYEVSIQKNKILSINLSKNISGKILSSFLTDEVKRFNSEKIYMISNILGDE